MVAGVAGVAGVVWVAVALAPTTPRSRILARLSLGRVRITTFRRLISRASVGNFESEIPTLAREKQAQLHSAREC
jgi:hypothetical protein